MDVTNPVKEQVNRLLEATRERPGVALALAVGGGVAVGLFASRLLFRQHAASSLSGAETEGEQGQPIRRANDSMAISGDSTPASSIAGEQPDLIEIQ